MKKTYLNLSFVVLIIAAVACNNNRERSASGSHDANEMAEESNERAEESNEERFDDKDMRNDADFVADQVAVNHAEVELARLAIERSSNPDVKRIAKNMLQTHQKQIKDLQQLASGKSITVPQQPQERDLKAVTDLREEKDLEDFNRSWCKEVMDKHEKAIDNYESQLKNTQDQELKTWISNTLPTLRHHLDEVKACHEKLKDS